MDDYLEQLVKERDQLIKSDPRAAKFQQEIDLALMSIDDPALRIMVLMKKISQGQERISDLCQQILSGDDNEK